MLTTGEFSTIPEARQAIYDSFEIKEIQCNLSQAF